MLGTSYSGFNTIHSDRVWVFNRHDADRCAASHSRPFHPTADAKRSRISRTAHLLGAPGEIRTPNLLIRSQMLYPLSYGRRSRTTDEESIRPAGHTGNRGQPRIQPSSVSMLAAILAMVSSHSS